MTAGSGSRFSHSTPEIAFQGCAGRLFLSLTDPRQKSLTTSELAAHFIVTTIFSRRRFMT